MAGIAHRIACRSFPSVFQAWTGESDSDPLTSDAKLARHDLVWEGLTEGASEVLGVQWAGNFAGQATSFRPASLSQAARRRAQLLDRNPNMVFLLELRIYDAPPGYLPGDSTWWKRDGSGSRVVSYRNAGKSYYVLDWQRSELQATVAAQARAVRSSGVYDGIMLDSYEHYAYQSDITALVRRALGESPLIVVNYRDPRAAQHNIAPLQSGAASAVNGQFLENLDASRANARQALAWDDRYLRTPRIAALEMQTDHMDDLKFVRMATTLVLTHGDGYVLVAIRNGNARLSDHAHRWYQFWDRKVGRPVGGMTTRSDGAVQREYSMGTVLYNPETRDRSATIAFSSPRTSAATGRTGLSFTVQPDDGDMFLEPAATAGKSVASGTREPTCGT